MTCTRIRTHLLLLLALRSPQGPFSFLISDTDSSVHQSSTHRLTHSLTHSLLCSQHMHMQYRYTHMWLHASFFLFMFLAQSHPRPPHTCKYIYRPFFLSIHPLSFSLSLCHLDQLLHHQGVMFPPLPFTQ